MRVSLNSIASVAAISALLFTGANVSATDSDYVPPHLLTEKNPTSVHEFMYHHLPSTEPVWILIKDITFRIPRNYLASLYKVRPYTPVSFRIQTLYPDFAGAKRGRGLSGHGRKSTMGMEIFAESY